MLPSVKQAGAKPPPKRGVGEETQASWLRSESLELASPRHPRRTVLLKTQIEPGQGNTAQAHGAWEASGKLH